MGKGKKRVKCDTRDCGIEDTVKEVFDKFSRISEKLAENQNIMQVQIQKLTDNIQIIGKVETRIEKMEDQMDNNTKLIYKIMGIGLAAAVAGPVLLSKLFG